MGIILVIFFITRDIYLVKIKIGMILILKRDSITDEIQNRNGERIEICSGRK